MDKIQMTEKQAIDLFDNVLRGFIYVDSVINLMEEKGYIKQTDLEIAKENYYDPDWTPPSKRIKEYVRQLEKEIERLNGK